MNPVLRRLCWLLFATVLGVAAGSLLFTTFMVYDDEGYVLHSLQSFSSGGGLYERVYSQYGPFFFAFNQLLHLGGAGLPFTNSAARVLTGCYWLAATGLCGALVWRATRSMVAAWVATAGVFLHLWSMTSEPSHPGGLIVFLVALAAWAGAGTTAPAPWRWAAVGLVGTALCLTKINVGVFLFAGAGAWWLLHLETPTPSLRVRATVLAVALAAMPALLMRNQLGLGWVATFAFVAGTAGVSVVLAAAAGADTGTHWRDAGWAVGAGLALLGVTVGAILLQGTSVAGLLEGVLLGPLRHPQMYMAHVNWRPGTVAFAGGSLLLAAGVVRFGRAQAADAIAALRLIATGWFFLAWIFDGVIHPHAFALSYALALTWLFVLPQGDEASTQSARSWLALLLLPQTLHAFPVAGSQISWGTFLWVPLAVIAAHGAWQRLAQPSLAARRILATAAVAALAGLTFRCVQTASLGVDRVRHSDRLALPGANSLLLPEGLTTALRVLARNAVAHGDVLFTMPGMMSFHLWTDLPPPTSLNATHWFSLLTAEQQAAIRRRLEATPRSVIIVQRDVLDFLRRNRIATDSPLAVWLQENYAPAFSLQTYEFWVRRGREIAAINTATVREAADGTRPRYRLAVTLAEADLRGVATIELRRVDTDLGSTVLTWTAADARVSVTPINSAGREAAAPRALEFPFATRGLVRVDLLTDRFPAKFPLGHGAVYFLDAAGRRLAEARIVN